MSYDPMENAFYVKCKIKNESETGGQNEGTFTKKTFFSNSLIIH